MDVNGEMTEQRFCYLVRFKGGGSVEVCGRPVVENSFKPPLIALTDQLFQGKMCASYCSFHSFTRKSRMALVTKRCAYATRPKFASNLWKSQFDYLYKKGWV